MPRETAGPTPKDRPAPTEDRLAAAKPLRIDASSLSDAVLERRPRLGMPSLDKIAEYWWSQIPDPSYGNKLSRIGLGEPFCFRCGWSTPEPEPGPDGIVSWRSCSRWLDRAHLEDHSGGGSEDVGNLVPLCVLCHKDMPDHDAGERDKALQWVKTGYRRDWRWQFWTDRIGTDLANRHKIEREWFRFLEFVMTAERGDAA